MQRGAIDLTCHNLHTYVQGALGGGVDMPLLQQDILQPRHPQASQKESHDSVILIVLIFVVTLDSVNLVV